MADFEEKHLDEMREMGLNIWSRFVDDVFATVNNKEEVLLMLD